jgi:hypothetical protein
MPNVNTGHEPLQQPLLHPPSHRGRPTHCLPVKSKEILTSRDQIWSNSTTSCGCGGPRAEVLAGRLWTLYADSASATAKTAAATPVERLLVAVLALCGVAATVAGAVGERARDTAVMI